MYIGISEWAFNVKRKIMFHGLCDFANENISYCKINSNP